jgi:hypothetical protein
VPPERGKKQAEHSTTLLHHLLEKLSKIIVKMAILHNSSEKKYENKPTAQPVQGPQKCPKVFESISYFLLTLFSPNSSNSN